MFTKVREGFIDHGWPEALVDEVLAAFKDAKSRFYRNDLRPQAVEGGLFSEGVLRVMQFEATGIHDPLSLRTFNAGRVIGQLEGEVGAQDSVRFHVPRAVRLIYDIRNNRDTGHLTDGIDPNLQDATLVVGCMDWILAEMVRLAHNVPADQAQAMIADIVKKEVPVIEVFDGKPVVLKDLRPGEHAAAILYWAGSDGLPIGTLKEWTPVPRRKNLRRALDGLAALYRVYENNGTVKLTQKGYVYVEENNLLKPG